MLDHVTLRVRDIAAAKTFYAAALAPLGYRLVMEFPDTAGFGVAGKPDFWLAADPEARPQHIAFSSPDRAAVAAFHAAALAAGATDNGPPGLRLDYHPNYYGAFVLDPSSHNIEAVCHRPPGAARKPAAKRVARGLARRSKVKRVAKGPKGLARKSRVRRVAKGPKG